MTSFSLVFAPFIRNYKYPRTQQSHSYQRLKNPVLVQLNPSSGTARADSVEVGRKTQEISKEKGE